MTKFRIREKEWDVPVGPSATIDSLTAWFNTITIALLALEDPRVDSILEKCKVVVENGDGVQLFPYPRPAILKEQPGETPDESDN